MGEDAKMTKELEKFEDYYMRTMEITGSRDNFPKDPQLVKDVINLFCSKSKSFTGRYCNRVRTIFQPIFSFSED